MNIITTKQIKLACFTAGHGPQDFILIHNAGGNHQFMNKQFDYFAKLGRVFSLDLRGHGESDKPVQAQYTVQSLAEDIIELCQEYHIESAVIIGLNYGAVIAIELAATTTKLVSHLVLIDPPILMEPWVKSLIEEHIQDLKNPNIEDFASTLVNSVLFNTDSANKIMATRSFETVSKPALASIYENLLHWDKTSTDKLKRCTCPMLHIQSSQSFCPEERLKNICPQTLTGKVVASGHWATLETPDQVNSMISRFLELFR